ncbi:MAG: TIR domain-containing protein [Elainellaceae cyanobacterium]
MDEFHDAFISYGRADSKSFARKLTDRLMEAGLDVWFDFDDIPLGVDYQNQIDDGIEKSHDFLFLISPHSVNSPYCRLEVELAIKRQKRIIPLMHVEEISRDTWQERNPNGTDEEWETYTQAGKHSSFTNLHPALGKINWVFFREGVDDFEASLAGLHSIFERHRSYVKEHTYLLGRSLHWQSNYRQTRNLLSGQERLKAEEWLRVRFRDEQPPCLPTDLHSEYITESTKNANNLMTQVFLASADADASLSERLRRSLNRESFTVWTSERDVRSGMDFAAANNQGIEEADNIVCVLSPELLRSPECQRQIRYAISLNKRLIPLMVRSVEAADMPDELRLIQAIDLTDAEDAAAYDRAIARLINNLRNDEDYYATHKVVLAQALKWERQSQNLGVLFRGHTLKKVQGWHKVAQGRSMHGPILLQTQFIEESLKLPTDSTLEVFISYSRADGDLARALNHGLQSCGKTTWFDQESIDAGEDFQQEVYRGIEISDNFLFIISPEGLDSPYCDDEVSHAQSLNKRIITILSRPVESEALHPALANVQWIDFSTGEQDFRAAFSELVRTLDTDREHVHQHTKWSQRSREWHDKGRSPDLLLRGSEFSIAQHWLEEAIQNKKNPAPTALQQEFMAASQAAIAAQIRREKRQLTILRSLLGSVSVVAVIAVCASVIAFQNQRLAQRQDLISLSKTATALLASNQGIGAITEGVEGIERLQRTPWARRDAELSSYLTSALLDALYWAREVNQLEGHTDGVRGVAFSPDGERIATTSVDNTVKLWQRDGKLLFTLTDHTDRVRDVAFSPDGSMFATVSADRTIRLWRSDGASLKVIDAHDGDIHGVDFSPDGDRLASASADGTVKLWDVGSGVTSSDFGQLVQTFEGHTDWVRDVKFSPTGETLASAGDDRTIRLWRLEGSETAEPTVLTGHSGNIESIDFSPDGRRLVSGSGDRTLRLWDLEGDDPVKVLEGHGDRVEDVAFSPDGTIIASVSEDRTLRLWSSEGIPHATLSGHRNSVVGVAFSPDGTRIATASWDMTARLWQARNPLMTKLTDHNTPLVNVAYSPTGDRFASASTNGEVIIWSAANKRLHRFKAHDGLVTQIRFAPSGDRIATSGLDGTVKLWDNTGQLQRVIQVSPGSVYTVAFHPSGETFATGSSDRIVRLWNLDGQRLQVYTGHTGAINQVEFSPSGDLLASASDDQTILLWDKNGVAQHPIHGHTGAILAMSFNPAGDRLATAGGDRTIRLWDRQGNLLQTLKGHREQITDLAFSPDGTLLASNGADGTISFWTEQGVNLFSLKGQQEQSGGLAFKPDGTQFVSGSSDTSVLVWNLSLIDQNLLENLETTACDWVHDYLRTNARVDSDDRALCLEP